jgi:AAA+ ATPase superfamily predicted ATPase
LGTNIKRLFMRRTGMFRSEPFVLVGDVIRRETQTYESVLKAIATGGRTPQEIGTTLGLASSYLKQMEALHLVERRIPATIPPERRRSSRYHLADSYLRFYFRFIEPNLELVELELTDELWGRISQQFRAFVGLTAFENLCREWTLVQARARRLPFSPEMVGSHWSPGRQRSPALAGVDVVAINWRDKAILLGECKWGLGAVGRSVVRELVDKAPRVVPGQDWTVHYAFFARSGFTDAARAEAESVGGTLVDLERLDADLREALENV